MAQIWMAMKSKKLNLPPNSHKNLAFLPDQNGKI